jgi:hypothetical protein
MTFQFNTIRLLRSIAFAAIGVRSLTLFPKYPDMVVFICFMAPAAFGGAIGALFGKTSHGAFSGLVVTVIAFAAIFMYVMLAVPIME